MAEEPATLLEIPGDVLRHLMSAPQFGQLVLSKMSERLARSATIGDLPRFGGQDRATLRRLEKEAAAAAGTAATSAEATTG